MSNMTTNSTAFESSLIKSLYGETPESTKLLLSHGTSLFNLIYSLSEGGKPATSIALSKINSSEDLGDAPLKKFGDVVLTFEPSVLFDKDVTIFTRDAYTMDSPNREIHGIDRGASIALSQKLKPFIQHTQRDVSEIFRVASQTGDVQSFTSVVEKLAHDTAFKLSFLADRGINIEVPYVPSRVPSGVEIQLANSLGGSLESVREAVAIPQIHQELIISAYDSYYKDLIENSEVRFHQIIGRKKLEAPEDERFSAAVDAIRDWVDLTENPPVMVDKTHLDNLISEELDKIGGAALLSESISVVTNLIEREMYCCNQKDFKTKYEAWEYIHENSHAQSQQSLTYSVNEIFSLKSDEIMVSDVFDKLGLIQPKMFLGGIDNPESTKASISEFKRVREALELELDFSYTVGAQSKHQILEQASKGELTASGILGERARLGWFNVTQEKEVAVQGLVEQLQVCYEELSEKDLTQLAFEDSYQFIRDLRKDLDTLLEVRELTFGESRDFNKAFYGNLVSHRSGDTRNFDVAKSIKLRKSFGRVEKLDSNRLAIESTMELMADAFENLDDHVPYFEVVMNTPLPLDSSKILSISVPESNKVDIEHLTKDYPYLASKVRYYNPDIDGSLMDSIENSGALMSPEFVKGEPPKRDRKRGLSL